MAMSLYFIFHLQLFVVMGSYFPIQTHANEHRNKNYKNVYLLFWIYWLCRFCLVYRDLFLVQSWDDLINVLINVKLYKRRNALNWHVIMLLVIQICTRKNDKINRWSIHQGQNMLVTLDSILIYESLIKKIISHYDEKLKTKK